MPRPEGEIRRSKDGRAWRIGLDGEVAWIRDGTARGLGITSAIPPLFAAYATVTLPRAGDRDPRSWLEDADRHAASVLAVLAVHTATQPWWLGYLETGIGVETIFYDVPKVTLYADWHYVLIEAGPEQARSWRGADRWTRKGPLPDLIFPADRSWLLSTMWDDDWTCIGGPNELVDAFVSHPDLGPRVRRVDPSAEDATPPGHVAI